MVETIISLSHSYLFLAISTHVLYVRVVECSSHRLPVTGIARMFMYMKKNDRTEKGRERAVIAPGKWTLMGERERKRGWT